MNHAVVVCRAWAFTSQSMNQLISHTAGPIQKDARQTKTSKHKHGEQPDRSNMTSSSPQFIYNLDNTAKRCGIVAVLHIIYYDVFLTLTHDLNKSGEGMQE